MFYSLSAGRRSYLFIRLITHHTQFEQNMLHYSHLYVNGKYVCVRMSEKKVL